MVEQNREQQTQQVPSKRVANSDMERTRPRRVFIPRTDITEQANSLTVTADMPGVDENSIDINVERQVLTIRGRVQPVEIKEHRQVYAEYDEGDYERSFALSDQVDVENIEATVKQGVLRIKLPKSEKAKPRKITVKAG